MRDLERNEEQRSGVHPPPCAHMRRRGCASAFVQMESPEGYMQRPPRSMERGGLFDPLSRRLGSTPCVGGPNVGRWKFHFGFGDLFSEKHCPMRASPFAFRQRATSPGTGLKGDVLSSGRSFPTCPRSSVHRGGKEIPGTFRYRTCHICPN